MSKRAFATALVLLMVWSEAGARLHGSESSRPASRRQKSRDRTLKTQTLPSSFVECARSATSTGRIL
jgi:hypothetical protein